MATDYGMFLRRESLALKRSTGRRGDLRHLAQHTTVVTDSDESDETVTLGELTFCLVVRKGNRCRMVRSSRGSTDGVR